MALPTVVSASNALERELAQLNQLQQPRHVPASVPTSGQGVLSAEYARQESLKFQQALAEQEALKKQQLSSYPQNAPLQNYPSQNPSFGTPTFGGSNLGQSFPSYPTQPFGGSNLGQSFPSYPTQPFGGSNLGQSFPSYPAPTSHVENPTAIPGGTSSFSEGYSYSFQGPSSRVEQSRDLSNDDELFRQAYPGNKPAAPKEGSSTFTFPSEKEVSQHPQTRGHNELISLDAGKQPAAFSLQDEASSMGRSQVGKKFELQAKSSSASGDETFLLNDETPAGTLHTALISVDREVFESKPIQQLQASLSQMIEYLNMCAKGERLPTQYGFGSIGREEASLLSYQMDAALSGLTATRKSFKALELFMERSIIEKK